MIDTHAHIYLEQFDEDRDGMIERAREAGLSHIIMPNIDKSTANQLYKTESAYPAYCYAAMGLHPTSVEANYQEELAFVRSELERRSFVALGEIGLDLYWDKTYIKEQIEALQTQLEWSLEFNLPVIIHVRNSHNEIIEAMQKFKGRGLRGVFHCFTGGEKEAADIFELGDFYLGIGGVVTFKNGGLAENIPAQPLEKLLLETDSPYLAPVPYRGKRNEPAYTALVRKKLSELYGISEEEINKTTTVNAKVLFAI